MMSHHLPNRICRLAGLLVLSPLLFFLVSSLVPESITHAATCTVTTNADSGEGSLRQKVGDATCDTITFDAAYFGVARTITLTAQLDIGRNLAIDGAGVFTPTISGGNTTRVLSITTGTNVTLSRLNVSNGNGNGGDGGAIHNSGTLTLTDSTLTGNAAPSLYSHGGGIYNQGKLIVTGSTVSGNTAHGYVGYGGGIYSGGTLEVTNSSITGNTGCGIFSSGSVIVAHSAVSYNGWPGAPGYAGGLVNDGGALTVTASTIAGNSGNGPGGGIYNNGELLVTNSTITANTGVVGGGIYNTGALSVTNTTIAGNSSMLPDSSAAGGIRNQGGTAVVRNTVIAKGTAGANCTGSAFAVGSTNNLDDDGSCSGGFTRSSTLLLGALGTYGGSAETIPLLPNSSAIDAGNDSACPPVDQRGTDRPQGAHCDIGAYESRGFTLAKAAGDGQTAPVNSVFAIPLALSVASPHGEPVEGGQVSFNAPSTGASTIPPIFSATIAGGAVSDTVTANTILGSYNVTAGARGAPDAYFALMNTACATNSITVANTNDSGAGSLRQAIADVCGVGAILFDGTYFGVARTITLSTQLDLGRNLVIDGAGVVTPTVSGGNATRVMSITATANVTLNRVKIANGNGGGGNGAGIYNSGRLTMTDTTVSGNRMPGYAGSGAGVYNEGTLAVTNGTFTRNGGANEWGVSDAGKGGGVYNAGTMAVTDTVFLSNTINSGGGIFNSGTLSMTASSVNGSGGSSGAGIYNSGTMTVSNAIVAGNGSHYDNGRYYGSGGGIENTGALVLTESTIASNGAYEGGGVRNSGIMAVSGSSLIGNVASANFGHGGGIANGGTLDVKNSTIFGNSAADLAGYGGGIYNTGALTVTNSTIAGNWAWSGNSGGGIYNGGGTATARNTIVAGGSWGPHCAGGFAAGSTNNLDDDGSCGGGFTRSSALVLGTLGDYGGSTQTIPLLPNSAAIDAGDSASCPSQDQRGVSRVGPCDVGAYESRGFAFAGQTGTPQSGFVGAPFAQPLHVHVTSGFGEPVEGGQVIFTGPVSEASIGVSPVTATISSGAVGQTVTANDVPGGPYNVFAVARGAAAQLVFVLTNIPASHLYLPLVARSSSN